MQALTIFPLARWISGNAAFQAGSTLSAIEALADGDLRLPNKLDGRDDFAWMRWKLSEARKRIAALNGKIASQSS